MTRTIFRPANVNSEMSSTKLCLYQELLVNDSRIVSLSSVKNTFNAFIALGNTSFFIDGGDISTALESIELVPYENLAKFLGPTGVCGVATDISLPMQALMDSKVTYVNATMTDYYVELYIVADYDMYSKWGSATETTIYQVVNYVNALYRGQGVHIFVVGMEVWKSGNPISVTIDSYSTLSNLATYRTTLTTKHDVIHLVSGMSFGSGVLGLAYTGGLCQFTYAAGLTTDRSSSSILLTASTMAHEIGHNFGLSHDASTCSCSPDPYCIMYAYSIPTSPGLKWSNCSISTLSQTLSAFKAMRCVQDIPNLGIITNADLCGNGVIDSNEDCDPGLMTSNSSCCDSSTCKFTSGSQCASGRCCDKVTCQPLLAGTQCRSVANQCDLPEYCDGVTEFCPDDRYKMNAIPCDNNKGYCYNGYCSSQNLQCQTILSSNSTASSSQCYQINQNSSSAFNGFCSYKFQYISSAVPYYNIFFCSAENIYCGTLQCTAYTSNGIFSGLSKVVNNETCYQTFFNANLTGVRDPGLVWDGASCGNNQWCINSVCQSITTVPSMCTCGSRGICNDFSSCHCDNGYSGVDCSTASGCGGSVDSGPLCVNNPVPASCPSSYCQNRGTCILNTNGTQCSFGAPYCCYCPGNYLEANCARTSTKWRLLMITSNTTFLSDYKNSSNVAFKDFERNLCQVVRLAFRRYLGTLSFSCRVPYIFPGSAIGATLIQGDTYLPSNGYVIADSITKYCRRTDSVSQSMCYNNYVQISSIAAYDNCTTANACPSNYNCTSIDSSTYICYCPPGYNNVSLSSSSVPLCITSPSISTITIIIIVVVVVGGSIIIIATIIAVVFLCKKKKLQVTPNVTADAMKDPQAEFDGVPVPGELSIITVPISAPQNHPSTPKPYQNIVST